MKNILLISPDFDVESFWISEEEGTCTEVVNDVAPVGLATIAGLTPDSYHVDIWDEVVHGRVDAATQFDRTYDLVGFTGYNSHYLRCVEVASVFRQRGVLTAIGGPGVSGMPEKYREHFDVLFVGEAERTWPRFLKDWERGEPEREYRQIEKLDLSESPLPRWDSIASDVPRYAMGGVQTTRGCPFDCEFCDVIYLFGRKMRHKPIDQVIEEVKALERLGASTIFFCDDEFIGEPRYTKELLKALVPVNNSFDRPLLYTTQLTMNLSKDDELLELVADSNFGVIFIGIETPNQASLKETSKYQNIRKDLVGDVRKILSYGIAVRAGLIVGFDHDTTEIFDIQERFVEDTNLPSMTLSLLKAIPGTRLWRRLREEGRVLDINKIRGDSKRGNAFKPRSYTNVVPKSMTRIELMAGYRKLAEKLYSWDQFSRRLRGFVSNVNRLPKVNQPPLTEEEMDSWRAAGAGSADAAIAVSEIIRHTEAVAPPLMRNVRMLTLQHAKHKKTFDDLLPYVDRLVELESSGALTFDLDRREVPIPQAFRRVFERGPIFDRTYRRVYTNLSDRARVPEALTDVFVDFLVRWGDSFESLEPQHQVFLDELSDRTCANLNGVPPESFVPQVEPPEIPSSRRMRLAEDVIRSVEQELVKLRRAGGSAGILLEHGDQEAS